MLLADIGYGLSGLLGLGIIFIGARFLLAPRAASASFGIAVGPGSGSADPYLSVKGVRDIASGLVVFILLAAGESRLLGGFMLAASVILSATPSSCCGATARRPPCTACMR
jgi:hypothetical protein